MLKTVLFSAAMLLPAMAFAAPAGVALTPNKAMTVYHGAPIRHTPSQWTAPRGKTKIFDTLGKPISYNGSTGWTLSNAQSQTGFQQWVAFAITPKANATVTEIAEAIGYVTGTDSITIALMADNNGSPGTVLAEKKVGNLEAFGSCCAVAVFKLKTGVPVTAGTTYWVGAILPSKKQATTWDAWDLSTANTGNGTFAYYNGAWNVTSGSYAAFAVYGS